LAGGRVGAAVAWDLPPAFGQWVTQSVVFFNTLVDRVVTQPTDVSSWWAKLGYRDDFLTLGEQYGRWWIEKPASNVLALPWPRMSVVDIVDRLDGYHQLKVFGLNGVHLLIACQGLLNGHQTVSEAFSDPAIREPAEAYWRVVEPVIALPPPTVQAFIDALRHRFSQPWLPHRLEDIAVRLVDKWWIRVAPSLDWWWDHHRQLPEPLVTVTRALLQYELQRDVSAQWHREWILQTLRLTPDDGLAWHCELVQQLSGDG
jgi:mannitol-1-phosphate/altronate dehydrogenase